MVKSDRLLDVDFRLACLEAAPSLSAAERGWVRLVMRSWVVWCADEPAYEAAWTAVGMRTRRLLVRSWRSGVL